jgi:hypothetical protein
MHHGAVEQCTTAQWLEHSEAWRSTHLDQAPSEALRRLTIQEHNRPLDPPGAAADRSHLWRNPFSRRRQVPGTR